MSLTDKQWAKVRKTWEEDSRTGFKWLIDELKLEIPRKTIDNHARRHQWTKRPYVPQKVPEGTQVSIKDLAQESSLGRPTLYKKEYAKQAYKLCLLGHTDDELAKFFEVNVSTINEWKHKHAEFSESIKEGRAIADGNVALSLYERACGYECDDVHVAVINEKVVLTPLRKHYPPDAASIKFWLNNRQSEKWRLKVEVEQTIIDPFPDKEKLNEIRAKQLARAKELEERRKHQREVLGLDVSGLLDDALNEE